MFKTSKTTSGGGGGTTTKAGAVSAVATTGAPTTTITPDLSDWTIPARVVLPDRVRKSLPKLAAVPVTPLSCSYGLVTPAPTQLSFREVVVHELAVQQADVAIVFCIRRAGCGSCREHAVQLTQDFQQQQQQEQEGSGENKKKIAIIGIIKDAHDHADMIELYEDYFDRKPLYHDANWTLGTAMGGRPLQLTDLMRTFVTSRTRFLRKNIKCQIGRA